MLNWHIIGKCSLLQMRTIYCSRVSLGPCADFVHIHVKPSRHADWKLPVLAPASPFHEMSSLDGSEDVVSSHIPELDSEHEEHVSEH